MPGMEHLYLVSYPYEDQQTPDEAKRPSPKQRASVLSPAPGRTSLQHRGALQLLHRFHGGAAPPRPPRTTTKGYLSSPTAAALASLAFNMRMHGARGSFLVHQATRRAQPQQARAVRPPGSLTRQVRLPTYTSRIYIAF